MKSEEVSKQSMRDKMNEVETKLNNLLGELESLGFELGIHQAPVEKIHQLSGGSIKISKRFHLTAIKTTREVI